MAVVLPFHAIRPSQTCAARTAALPYDVYNRAEARVKAAEDALSFLNIDRPETQFPENYDMYAPEVYRKAAEMLQEQIEKGIYVRDAEAGYYLYELTMNGRSQTGIVACCSIDDYMSGVIRKHENTREEKELDRIAHVDTVGAQTGPIFLSYRNDPVIARVVEDVKKENPAFDFKSDDGIRHRGWTIFEQERTAALQQAFSGIERLYIADGHHRAASAVKVGLKRRQAHPDYNGTEAFNTFLSVIFPDSELKIMDYNRVVKDLNGLEEKDFLEKLQGLGILEKSREQVRPTQKGQVGIYLKQTGWYRLTFCTGLIPEDPVESLDVAVLQRQVLTPFLGIQDPRTDPRIDFVGGIRGLDELERRVSSDCAAAFSMYPTSMDELFAVADAGLLMPPKSTWFEPKLRSGLFIHALSD